MIKSELGTYEDDMACHVEIGTVSKDVHLKKLQITFELMSIYKSLYENYSFDDVMDIITEAFKMFQSSLD